MDFSIAAPQLRMALDKMIVRIFSDQWQVMKASREDTTPYFHKWGVDLERIKSWSIEMESGEKAFRRELQVARKQIEENAIQASKPSREIDDYAISSGLGNAKGPSSAHPKSGTDSEKQGWLNLRTITGKPARTLWVRRWFFIKNGIFAWLVQGSRSGGVEESERIGVLLCGVRVSTQEERRFCFEVKTKDISILLQAESQPELTEWLSTFDAAKRKALEDPSSVESPGIGPSRPIDPAFSISPPNAPEFTASVADSGMPQSSDDNSSASYDRTNTLSIPGGEIAHRGSFDIGALRRPSGNEKEGESSRDHAARIIQKLDITRKAGLTGSPLIGGSPSMGSPVSASSAGGGIASLISASHMAMPVAPSMPPPQLPVESQRARTINGHIMRNLPYTTLAPSTFAHPPATTNLSVTAVIVNEERGIGVGRVDKTGGMPSGIMANLWGSSNWGYMNRL
jgi:hypothetical protein